MLLSLTNITGLTGLLIIFISAGLIRDGLGWLPGIISLLVILVIRNVSGEITRKQEILFSLLTIVIVLVTFLIILTN